MGLYLKNSVIATEVVSKKAGEILDKTSGVKSEFLGYNPWLLTLKRSITPGAIFGKIIGFRVK